MHKKFVTAVVIVLMLCATASASDVKVWHDESLRLSCL